MVPQAAEANLTHLGQLLPASQIVGGDLDQCQNCSSSQVTEPGPRKPKRRRILDPSTIVPVSVYSNKVSRFSWSSERPAGTVS